jgi:hypothetical protein
MLLLSVALAHATTTIGTDHTFGLGVASGPSAIDLTGKLYFNEKSGLEFFVGTSGISHNARVVYQSNIHSWGDDWSWGQLPLYWHADVDLGVTTYPGYPVYPRIGAGGGVGVAAQFNKFPLEVFVEAGLGIYPLNGYCSAVAADTYELTGVNVGAACWVGGLGAGGVRWYF